MPNSVKTVAYDNRYEQTRVAAAHWPAWRLIYVLHFQLPLGRHDEDAWGAIDAMADLIRESSTNPLVSLPR